MGCCVCVSYTNELWYARVRILLKRVQFRCALLHTVLSHAFPIDNVHLSRKAGFLAKPLANCNERGHHHHISLAVPFRRSRLHLLAMVDIGQSDECALLDHRHHRLGGQLGH